MNGAFPRKSNLVETLCGLRPLQFSTLPTYGDHMTIGKFVSIVNAGNFRDYDGHGVYATATQRTNAIISPSDITSGKYDSTYTHIVWFNK